jgi:hypothetical protein
MVRMGGALLRLYSPGALAMPAQVKQATPRTRLRAGNFQFQGSGDCAGAFASGKTPGPSFTGNVILAGKWLELTERDIEPAAGSVAENLIGYDAKQERSVESDAKDFGAAGCNSGEGCLKGVLSLTWAVNEDPKAPYAANRRVCSTAAPDNLTRDTFTVDRQIPKTPTSNWINADQLVRRSTQLA